VSIHTVERALFDIASSPARAAEYKADREKFLGAYPLQPDELQMVLELDVREMHTRGANPMLVMRAFSSIEGRERVPEYMRRLNAAGNTGSV
jgi:hypothetical protein